MNFSLFSTSPFKDEQRDRTSSNSSGRASGLAVDSAGRDETRDSENLKMCDIFELPRGQIFIEKYLCAFAPEFGVMIQGHMFLFPDYVCFDSRLIGRETTITMPYAALAQVSKERTLGIPNALEISMRGEGTAIGVKLWFNNFLSRDEVYSRITAGLSKADKAASTANGQKYTSLVLMYSSNNAAAQRLFSTAVGFAVKLIGQTPSPDKVGNISASATSEHVSGARSSPHAPGDDLSPDTVAGPGICDGDLNNSSSALHSPGGIAAEAEFDKYLCALRLETGLLQLVQGHILLFQDYVVFHSKLIGHETTISIRYADILSLSKKTTLGVFQNAIEISTVDQGCIFLTSFLSRDDAYSGIIEGMKLSGHAMETLSPPSPRIEFEIEEQRIAQIRKSLTILHRWTDLSYGQGFDVLIYPDAVVSLHPTDVSLNKVIVFPSSTRVRTIYTAHVTKPNEASLSVQDVKRDSNQTDGLKCAEPSMQPRSSAGNLSSLRICLRSTSHSEVSDSDIVLSWIEQDNRGKKTVLERPHYAFIKALCHASDQCIVSHFKPQKIKQPHPKNLNGLLDVSTSRELACLFVEDEGQEENGTKVSRTVSVNEGFAQQHPAAFDSFSGFNLELRKSCLRRVMKCVLASEHSKSTLLKVKDIHASKGRAVLEIVQDAHSALESACATTKCDFTTLEDFEKYAETLLVDLMSTAHEVIQQAINDLAIGGVDYYSSQSNADGFFCCDHLLVLMKNWYDHSPKSEQPLRSQGYTGFPVVRSAEISFVRQIQLLMFSIYEERLNLEVSRIGLEEVLAVMTATSSCLYHRDYIIERLLVDENPQSSPQSKCKCMVGKYIKDEDSESKCKETAEKIADFVLSPEFKDRVNDLRACNYPQHLACCCRLMIDDIMKFLPKPDCAEAMYGADDLANFAAFLWECVMIPLLMTNGDASYRTRIFVKILISQMYGNVGENDSAERECIIDKMSQQIVIHSRAIYEASKFKFAELKKNLISNDGGSLFMGFIGTLDASELDHLCEPIIRVFGTGIDMENVLRKLIYKEVSVTKDEGTLFRRNSSATKLMTHFTWKVAKSYLVDSLGKIIQSIIDGPVMEAHAADGADAQVHVQILGEKCLQIIESLVQTVRHMPHSVRRLVLTLQTAVESTFPNSKYIVSAGYLFVRVIVPCILQPDKFGMCQRPIEERDRRNLVLVGKVLQNLSNGNHSSENEGVMKAMNPFLQEHKMFEQLKDYIQSLANEEVIVPASDGPASLDECSTIEDQMRVHQMLLTKFQNTSHALLLHDLQPPPENDSVSDSVTMHPSAMFYVKGRGPGLSPDDHFMTVLNMCSATMCNFYEPMRQFIIESLAARNRAQSPILCNAQEIVACNVTIRDTGLLAIFTRQEHLVANSPTHVRFVTSKVPAGLFVIEQMPTDIVLPLVLSGSELTFKLPDNIITKSLPKDPPFYSGRQHSAFFPCDAKNFQVTVTLLKSQEEGQSLSEIQTLQFGSSSSRIQTVEQNNITYKVELVLRNWLFQGFPTQDPPSKAFWYYEADHPHVMHACLPETVAELEANYAVFSSECRQIEGHKFSMPIPQSLGVAGVWMFEAVSLAPTYVMMQVNTSSKSQRRVIRASFQSAHI